MKSNAIFPIFEGIVSNLNAGSTSGPIGQAGTPWLRGMKEIVNLNARLVANDFLFDVTATLTATKAAIFTGKAGYIQGALITSNDAAASSVYAVDCATGTTYTAGTTAYSSTVLPVGGVYLAIGSTNPQFSGLLWSPYFKATLGLQVVAVAASDEATAATGTKVNWYDVRRNI